MVGIENLKKLVTIGCEVVNVGSKILNGGGIWSLMSLINDVSVIKTLDKNAVLLEIKDLSVDERKELLELAKSTIHLTKPEIEAKVDQGLDLVNEAVDLGISAIALVESGIALVNKASQIVKA